MTGKEKWFAWLLFLALCRPGWRYFGLGTWSCFSSPHESLCPHWYPTKKQFAFSNRSLHKKAWSSIIWGYFQPYLWSSLTWSHREAKAGAAIILPPHGMSLLLMFSWSDLSAAATAMAGDNCSWQKRKMAQKNAQNTSTSSAEFSQYSQQGNEFYRGRILRFSYYTLKAQLCVSAKNKHNLFVAQTIEISA